MTGPAGGLLPTRLVATTCTLYVVDAFRPVTVKDVDVVVVVVTVADVVKSVTTTV